MNELDRFVNIRDAQVLPGAVLPGRKPAPTPKPGEPDHYIGKLALEREDIVAALLAKTSIVCDTCSATKPSEHADPVVVQVLASEMPGIRQFTHRVELRRCQVCRRIWNPFTLEWVSEPAGIEERQ